MRAGEGVQLLEVGVSWPPETFLRWKYTGLSERHVWVTVAAADIYDPSFELPGARLFPIPMLGERLSRLLPGLARDCLRLLARSPRRLFRLVRAVRDEQLASPARERISYRRRPWAALLEDLRWLRIFVPLARLRPDVVHFEWESTAIRYLPLTAVWRCPMVMSCHGGLQIYGSSAIYSTITSGLPRAFGQAAAVQCVSPVEREEALRHGLAESKVVMLPCGVDPERFRPPARRARGETLRVISVGWLRWLKGYEYAVRTIRALLDLGVPAQLEIYGGDPPLAVGEPSERPRILQAVEDLGLEGHVLLRGHASSDQLSERYREADVLLHSSVSEGLPVVILEAMASELPVVATDCGGVRGAVRDGVEGIVVPVRAPGAAAAALARIWADPERAAQMGRAGRERVLSSFTLAAQLDGFERLYVAGAAAS